MAFVTYSIHSKSGNSHTFEEAPCFSGLRELNKGIDMLTKGVWKSCETDPLSYITLHLNNEDELSEDIIENYYNYLQSHKFWGKMFYFKNGKDYKEGIIVKVEKYSGALLLSILTLLRCIDEYPTILISFNNILSLDYVCNKDIAFLLSQVVSISKGGEHSRYINQNSNHMLLDIKSHTLSDIVSYAKYFPYEDDMSSSYVESYKLGGNYEYFKLECREFSIYNSLGQYKLEGLIERLNNEVLSDG